MSRKTSTTVYLDESQLQALKTLAEQRRTAMAVLIREAIARLLVNERGQPVLKAVEGG